MPDNQPTTATWDRVFTGFGLITFDELIDDQWGLIENGALAIAGKTIAWVGWRSKLPEVGPDVQIVEGNGQYLSPGLIDCHTHLVYGGSRADEWQRRLQGVSYQQIASEGGGILSTVRATRAASADELFEIAKKRAEFLISQGVTTIEIKSGYGLDVESELKMLSVARRLGQALPISVHGTLLGAHAVAPEFKERPDDYVSLVCDEMIPGAKDLATSVDVFTERIAFDLAQTERVFRSALDAGYQIKIHAEQLSNMGGAKLAAKMGALSADHLEYVDEAGVAAMAESGTVATLLPGAFYFLRETQKPPVDLLRKYNVPMAIATDSNPGSSPVTLILLMANMACTLFGMTPSEGIRGLTINAARALGVDDQLGSLKKGTLADFVCWNIQSPAELAYSIGGNPCRWVVKSGRSNDPIE